MPCVTTNGLRGGAKRRRLGHESWSRAWSGATEELRSDPRPTSSYETRVLAKPGSLSISREVGLGERRQPPKGVSSPEGAPNSHQAKPGAGEKSPSVARIGRSPWLFSTGFGRIPQLGVAQSSQKGLLDSFAGAKGVALRAMRSIAVGASGVYPRSRRSLDWATPSRSERSEQARA